MQLNSRDEAEQWAAKIDLSGIPSKHLQRQTVRIAADFYQLVGKDLDIKVIRSEGDRSYADPNDRSIGMEDGSPRTRRKLLFHEMGHCAEHSDAEHLKFALDWVKNRAIGEPELLSKLDPGTNYDDDEFAFPDHFVDPYVGKQYSSGSTEVYSMGLEKFSDGRKVVQLFKQDREHFNLIIRYIRQ